MKLQGKKIIVTGGASGMGAAAVKVFANEGAAVVSIDVNDVNVEDRIEGVTYVRGNVVDKEEITRVINSAVETLGGVDSLFCIAGINRFTPTEQIEEKEFDSIFSVNVKGVFFCNQAILPHMKEKGGSIVNFGSQAAIAPGPDSSHYAASKAAVAAFSNKVAWEWGQYNIRVNTVLPSAWTPLFEKLCCGGQEVTPEMKEQMQAGMKSTFPLGHLGDPETEIAPVLVFLASDDSKYISAQSIAINGGSASVR